MNFLSKTFRYENAIGQSITFDTDNGFLLNLPDGVDTISVNLSTAQGVGQVGATVQATQIQVRPITLDGKIIGSNAQELKDRLVSVVRPDVGGTLYANDWHIAVVVTSTPVIGPERMGATFQFGLTAPYPYWINGAQKGDMLIGVEPAFKFPWNISKVYRFGQKMLDKYAVITNNGQVDVPYVLVVSCIGSGAENVKVENLLTGEFLLLGKTLVEGETVTINVTHDRTYVTSSEDGDCRGALTLESNLYRLHTGDNVWKPTADSGLENLVMQVSYAEESGGITVV